MSKTGRIEGHGALTDVTIGTSSGRAHVVFRESKKHHDGEDRHDKRPEHDEKDDKDQKTDEDPQTTTTEEDKPKKHPHHHTKPEKSHKDGDKHSERHHKTRA